MSIQYCYHYAGLRIRADLLIADWADFAVANLETVDLETADVDIRLCDYLPPVVAGQANISASEYRFSVPDTADYCVRHGREIVIVPRGNTREICLILLGTAWAALCYQRGLLLLHTSAVRLGDSAVAFCGESGAGKSSTTAWLLQRGADFVGDDLCRIDAENPGKAEIYPAPPRLKLWQNTLAQLAIPAERLERDQFRFDKYHTPVAVSPGRQPLPLHGICLLEWGPPALTRLYGQEALRRLITAATYRPYLLEPMGITAEHWQRCLQVVQRVPVYVLRREKDWASMDEAMQAVLKQWPV